MSDEIQKARSPNSPKYDLSQAIDLVRRLYEKIGRSPVKAELAAGALGYAGLNGAALATLGTISQYGLITRTAGSVQITPLALRLLHPVDVAGKAAALREAALAPRIFAEIYEKWNDMSEEVLANHLIHQNFTPDAARRASAVYKTNSALANLDSASNVQSTENKPKPSELPPQTDSSLAPQKAVAVQAEAPRPASRENVLATFKIPIGPNQAELIFTGEKLMPEDFDALADYVGLFKKQYLRAEAQESQLLREAQETQRGPSEKLDAIDLTAAK